MRYSKGPWIVRDDANTYAIIGAGPTFVLEINKKNHEALANAVLVAAATDLYEAAHNLEVILAPFVDAKMSAPHLIKAVEDLREAMRRAEG